MMCSSSRLLWESLRCPCLRLLTGYVCLRVRPVAELLALLHPLSSSPEDLEKVSLQELCIDRRDCWLKSWWNNLKKVSKLMKASYYSYSSFCHLGAPDDNDHNENKKIKKKELQEVTWFPPRSQTWEKHLHHLRTGVMASWKKVSHSDLRNCGMHPY